MARHLQTYPFSLEDGATNELCGRVAVSGLGNPDGNNLLQRYAAIVLNSHSFSHLTGETPMLRWALVFLVVALLSALFGFTDVAGTSMVAAKILFFVFLVMFIVSMVMGYRAPRDTI